MSNVTFLDPVHNPNVNMTPGVPSPVAITVRWQNNGGASLTGGMVSVFLVKTGDPNTHCDKKSFTAATAQPIPFSFTGTATFYGQYTIKCYVTGTATDGEMNPMAHGHGTTQHC